MKGKFYYHQVTFEKLIRTYLEHNLTDLGWETLAIDPHKRVVVLKGYDPDEESD